MAKRFFMFYTHAHVMLFQKIESMLLFFLKKIILTIAFCFRAANQYCHPLFLWIIFSPQFLPRCLEGKKKKPDNKIKFFERIESITLKQVLY